VRALSCDWHEEFLKVRRMAGGELRCISVGGPRCLSDGGLRVGDGS